MTVGVDFIAQTVLPTSLGFTSLPVCSSQQNIEPDPGELRCTDVHPVLTTVRPRQELLLHARHLILSQNEGIRRWRDVPFAMTAHEKADPERDILASYETLGNRRLDFGGGPKGAGSKTPLLLGRPGFTPPLGIAHARSGTATERSDVAASLRDIGGDFVNVP